MPTHKEKLDKIGKLLREQSTLALATVDRNGEAWIAPVFYLYGACRNLYWFSSKSSRHSSNLQANPMASCTVYRQTPHWKEICGVQMRGMVTTVGRLERRKLAAAYCDRFALGPVQRMAMRGAVLYKFEPRWIRYIENAQRFRERFEISIADGWTADETECPSPAIS